MVNWAQRFLLGSLMCASVRALPLHMSPNLSSSPSHPDSHPTPQTHTHTYAHTPVLHGMVMRPSCWPLDTQPTAQRPRALILRQVASSMCKQWLDRSFCEPRVVGPSHPKFRGMCVPTDLRSLPWACWSVDSCTSRVYMGTTRPRGQECMLTCVRPGAESTTRAESTRRFASTCVHDAE